MYCPECGKQNREDANYCGYCGYRLQVLMDHDPAYAPEFPEGDLLLSDSPAMEEEECTESLKEDDVDIIDKTGTSARRVWKNRFWIMGILWLIAPYAGQLILLTLPNVYVKRIIDLFSNSAVYGQLSAEMARISESISNLRFSGVSDIIPMAGRTVSLFVQVLRAGAAIIILTIRTLPVFFLNSFNIFISSCLFLTTSINLIIPFFKAYFLLFFFHFTAYIIPSVPLPTIPILMNSNKLKFDDGSNSGRSIWRELFRLFKL